MMAGPGLRVVDLNRPAALNALNLSMIRTLSPLVEDWAQDDGDVNMVVIRGAGGKAFCAGGDIRALHDDGKDPATRERTHAFFHEEYTLNHMLGTHKVPIISILDGITMGGGVGLSVHGKFRIATENTLFAMPETAIGFFPDVGGSHFLPRLRHNVGTYLALTGARLTGRDVLRAGIATHFVPSERLEGVELALASMAANGASVEQIDSALLVCDPDSAAAEPSRLFDEDVEQISQCFSHDTVEAIVEAVAAAAEGALAEGQQKHWAVAAQKQLSYASPTSLKVTLRQIRYGRSLSLAECLSMEYRMAQHFMRGQDFFEGVRAMVIERKRKQAPAWSPPRLEDVSEADVEAYFAPVQDGDELHLSDNLLPVPEDAR